LPIEYKDREQYLHSQFNSRDNLVAYLKKYPSDIETIKQLIQDRIDLKGLLSAPSTVESRTCLLPTPLLVEKCGHRYNKVCHELGLKLRFDYTQLLTFDESRLEILQDTREQLPLKFKNGSTVTALNFGDYTTNSHYKGIYVERKSLSDLCGTLSGGFERLKREIERAKEMSSYLIICVEEPIKAITELEKNPEHNKHSKCTSKFICHRVREISQSFNNVQFVFVKGRKELVPTIENIFKLNNDIKKLDLQYYIDSGKL